jgi:VWFA-related protein
MMMSRTPFPNSLPSLLLLVFFTSVSVPAAPAAEPQSKPTKVLSVIARDQSGAVVRDLTVGELEVVDNGVRREILSFRTPADLRGEKRLVVLVFGGLSNQGRQYARRAANDFLKEEVSDNVVSSVFVIDRRLYATSKFIDETKELEQAVQVATSGSLETYRRASERIDEQLRKSGDRISDLDRVVADALSIASQMQREDWTYAALDSLNVLVDQLARIEGRKAILFFSEGLVIRDVMFDRFNLLVNDANTAQTAIYTVDARGLLTEGLVSGARDMLGGASSAAASQHGATGATSSWQATALETAGQAVRMNVQEALANLSVQTGGFLIGNTNDSRPGMKRITEELDQYYELGYSPDDAEGEGALRQLTVKSLRPSVEVFAPTAYLDLPAVGGLQFQPYELPILQTLAGEQLANDFHLKARVLHFGRGEKGIQHTLALEVPMGGFEFSRNEELKLYFTNFALLALIKDPQENLLYKFSQDYPLQGPLERMAGMKEGNMLFLRNFHLPPGRYWVEAGVRDDGTGKVSALREELVVSEPPGGLALSSLMVIDRVDQISDMSRELDNPLRYQSAKIAPNMGHPIPITSDGQIGFYCVVYPSKQIGEPVVLALLFFRDGAPLFQGRPPLPTPDEEGKVQMVLNLPLSNFAPGNYEVVAVVQQGEGAVEERVGFTLVAN